MKLRFQRYRKTVYGQIGVCIGVSLGAKSLVPFYVRRSANWSLNGRKFHLVTVSGIFKISWRPDCYPSSIASENATFQSVSVNTVDGNAYKIGLISWKDLRLGTKYFKFC